MTRRSRAARVAATAACALGALPVMAGAADAATTTLQGTTAPSLTQSAAVGAVSTGQPESLQLWLAPNLAGATAFDNAVSTPGNSSYHQYLTPAQYTAQFGPSQASAQAVSAWLTSQGFTGVTVSPQRDYVSASGTAGQVNQAFGVQMTRYQTTVNGKSATVQANNQPLSIPSSLSGDVISVTGLNSTAATTYHTANPATAAAKAPQCSQYWAQSVRTLKVPYNGITQSPYAVCGYSADQLRAGYAMSNAATGSGVTIALIEQGAPYELQQTVAQYAATNGLPAPLPGQIQEQYLGAPGSSQQCGDPFDGEEQLDAEAAYAMAPGANQLMVEGDPCSTQLQGVQSLFDAETAVLQGDGTKPSASIESNSWGITGGESYPVIYASTAHAIDLRAAAEGVSMLFSSGDNPGISVPASDPYSTSVGGTTLGLGQTNNRLFETGWSDSQAVNQNKQWVNEGIGRDASGGGTSLLYAQPSYQQGVVPASMSTTSAGAVNRTVPDLSADADPDSGILQGDFVQTKSGPKYQTFVDGGTSLASPLVAGVIADAEQGQSTSLGFLNPLLYSLAGTSAFNDALPITTASPVLDQTAFVPAGPFGPQSISQNDSQGALFAAYTSQVTATGYDTMTGLGTPNGPNLISALRAGS